MRHSILVTEEIMHSKADYADSRGLLPELILKLITASIKNPTELRIPFGGSTGQPGWDGSVVSPYAFPPYVPEGQSFWEISAGNNPESRANENFDKRTSQTSEAEQQSSTFIFVTPRSASHGWTMDDQKKWLEKRRGASKWKDIQMLDATKLVQWLGQFPGIDFWLAEQFKIPTKGLSSPIVYWEDLKRYGSPPDLNPDVFLIGQDKAVAQLLRVFHGESQELLLATRYPEEGIDFLTAALASLDIEQREAFAGRCLIIDDPETWKVMCYLQESHVFVATPSLDVLNTCASLRNQARNKGHGVVFAGTPLSGVHGNSVRLAEAKQYDMEKALVSCGYQTERARMISNKCGGRIIILKRLLLDISASPDWALTGMASELSIADLIGQWNGNYEGDRKAIEGILGKPYGEWIGKIRPMSLRPDPPLIQRDEKWRFISRFEGWQSLGPYLSNDDLDRFQKQALIVLREKDPKFTLPIDERWNASIHGSNPTYSEVIKEGLAETLALLGSYPKALSSCTAGKPESVAAITVREILKDADWVQWASLNNVLPLIAEASPEQFLNAIDSTLNDPDNTLFQDLFGQESTSFGGWNYMTGVLWALETLAWHKDYLSRVTMILGRLAEIDPGGNWGNRPSNSLTTIFLPWLPQTCAPMEIRKVAVEALLKECPAVAWNLLLKLLPSLHQVSSGSRRPSWREFIPCDHSDNVSREEHLEQVSTYTRLTVRAAEQDIKKLSELIERLDNLTPQAYSEVLEHLSSEAVLNLSEQEKASLWEALVDIVTKHRTFKDAVWVMHREQVDRIAGIAEMLKPISPELVHRRLFCQHHQLIEDIDNYQEQLIKLDERRTKAIQEILDFSGIEGISNFARSVSDSQQVGLALGRIGTDEFDSFILPKFLVYCAKPMESVTAGYVWSRFAKSGWPWIDSIKVDDWTNDQKAALLILMPFSRATWQRVKKLLKDKEVLYWKKTETRPYHLKEDLPEAVERLLEYGRARAAIQCLYWMAHEKMVFQIDLVYRALMENLKSEESVDSMDQHACMELIKWLQNNPEADNEILTTVEWHYLSLLDSHFGLAPKTLERRLAEDPNFFCTMIQVIFRSKKEEKPLEEPSEEQKRIATNAFDLLHKWKTPPGTKPDSSFEGATLKRWLAEVKRICEASGHLRIALDQTGKVLAHSPADPSGLWIHKGAAEVLDEKDHDIMRTAFWVELSNQRGVFSWTAGEAERALAAGFYQKADALEKEGYIQLAASVRVLAASYERDADRESTQDPFDL
jgi:hypothetical protein